MPRGPFPDAGRNRARDAIWAEAATSAERTRRVLVYVLDGCLRLLHPYMPFITEAIWQYLPHEGEANVDASVDGSVDALIVAPWPQAGPTDTGAEERMGDLMELVRAIRNARSEYDVEPGRRIAAIIAAGERLPFLRSQAAVLATLARVDEERLEMRARLDAPPEKALTLVVGGTTCYLPLAALIDLDRERARLRGEIEGVDKEIAHSERLLSNQGFVTKAPEAVVQKERDKLAENRERRDRLQERLAGLA